jgi:hypothetical protein
VKTLTVTILAGLVAVGIAQDSLNCHELGTWPVGLSYAAAIDSARNLAFVDSAGVVFVLDVSDPALPVELSDSIRAGGVALDLCFGANRLFVAAAEAGLEIWDVGSPAAPTLMGQLNTPGYSRAVAVADSYAYVADGDAGLRIINVSNPQSPVDVGHYDTPGYAYGVAVAGGYAYVADHLAGLRIIDVSNPQIPIEVGHYDTVNSAQGVAVAGSYVYLADYEGGLRVIDVSNPQNPFMAGHYDTPGYAMRVTLSDNLAYVADYYAGLRIIDVSNPQSPFEAGYYFPAGNAMDVAVANPRAYVADHSLGLRIIEYNGTGVAEVTDNEELASSVGPTLVRGVLNLQSATCNLRSEIALLDASARRLMSLHPGPNDVSALAPGAYFIREEGLGIRGSGKTQKVLKTE